LWKHIQLRVSESKRLTVKRQQVVHRARQRALRHGDFHVIHPRPAEQ
jgi:hypothetical protein